LLNRPLGRISRCLIQQDIKRHEAAKSARLANFPSLVKGRIMKALPTSDFRNAYHDHIRHDVIGHIPKTGGKLLDLGGGIGATAAAIREMGLVDKIGTADLVSNENPPFPLDYSYQGNLEDPAMLDHIVAEQGKFQMILALDILEHLLDPWAMAKKLEQSLAPGGVLVVSIPNIRNFTALFPLMFRNKFTYQDAGILDRTHLRFFVRETAVDLIAQTGLRVEKIAPSATGGKKIRLIRKLTLGLFNSFTDRQYVIVGRKA
jgi:2-polyprenyl-3-methyl-5-hydroxy-6-metoxy-1,4-benzoquinol methylase